MSQVSAVHCLLCVIQRNRKSPYRYDQCIIGGVHDSQQLPNCRSIQQVISTRICFGHRKAYFKVCNTTKSEQGLLLA
jgi:hypothetical protein